MTSAIFYTYLTIVHLWAWGGLADSDRAAEIAAAARKPKIEHTVTAHGDTVSTPIDFRLAWSITQDSGPWHHRFAIERERQDGAPYWGGEQYVERRGERFGFGYSIEDWQESDYYLAKLWWELRVGGILGFGFTRAYSDPWFDGGTMMGRLSVTSEQPIGGDIRVVTAGTYEFNQDRQNTSIRCDVRGAKAGPVEIVPSAYWKRTNTSARWLAEVKARVAF